MQTSGETKLILGAQNTYEYSKRTPHTITQYMYDILYSYCTVFG